MTEKSLSIQYDHSPPKDDNEDNGNNDDDVKTDITKDDSSSVSVALIKRKELERLRKKKYHGLSTGSMKELDVKQKSNAAAVPSNDLKYSRFQRASGVPIPVDQKASPVPKTLHQVSSLPSKPPAKVNEPPKVNPIEGFLSEIDVRLTEQPVQPKSKKNTSNRSSKIPGSSIITTGSTATLNDKSDLDKQVDALLQESNSTSSYLAPSFSRPEPKELTTFEKHLKEKEVRRMHANIELAMRYGAKRGSYNNLRRGRGRGRGGRGVTKN